MPKPLIAAAPLAVLLDQRPEFDRNEPLGTFVVKVASRCNIACSYCYMYEHPDQSWRTQPSLISSQTVELFAERLGEYARARPQTRWLTVVAHGGEPLLLGAKRLDHFFGTVREALEATGTKAHLGLQTNGLLVSGEVVSVLQKHHVHAGVSLDGPARFNDRFRVDHAGRGTTSRVLQGVEKLMWPVQGESAFGGILAVADPDIPPSECLESFITLGTPYIDFLLPDFNHDTYPHERRAAGSYGRWLAEIFDLWIASGSSIEIRTFTVMMRLMLGSRYGYDAFGARSRGVCVIETDGTIHGLDVLKTSFDGATRTGLRLQDTAFESVERTLGAVALSSKAVVACDQCLNDFS